MNLADHPVLLFAALLGCGVMAAIGVGLLAIALYGFVRWIEVKKAKSKRRRRKRLHYADML